MTYFYFADFFTCRSCFLSFLRCCSLTNRKSVAVNEGCNRVQGRRRVEGNRKGCEYCAKDNYGHVEYIACSLREGDFGSSRSDLHRSFSDSLDQGAAAGFSVHAPCKPATPAKLHMKLKQLEACLSQVKPFDAPQYELEQYPTSAHLAARILYTAAGFQDVEDRVVFDLGTGTGMFAIGAQVMGAGMTTGFDIDPSALEVAKVNSENVEVDVDFVLCDVAGLAANLGQDASQGCDPDERALSTENGDRHGRELSAQEVSSPELQESDPSSASDQLHGQATHAVDLTGKCDTVFMNPPFGTRVKGIDMVFLRLALSMATTAVYTLHKSSTRKHVLKVGARSGAVGQVLATLKFDVPKMYAFHRKASKDIEVDFIRFDKTALQGPGAAAVAAAAAEAAALAFPPPAAVPRRGKPGSHSKGKSGNRNKGGFGGAKSSKGRGKRR